MENEFFLNAGLQPPPLQFEPPARSSSSLTMPNWHSISSAMDIDQSQDCLFSKNWERPATEHSMFESALTSLVSSPATATASKSNRSNDSLMIRELIGKLGNIGNHTGEILPSSASSCYSTPLNSPPKLSLPVMDYTIPNMGNATPLGPTVGPELAADPAFVERAARLSCFGSRSFNDRTTPFTTNNNTSGNHSDLVNRSNAVITGSNGKLQRVSSTSSLVAVGSQDESTVCQRIANGVNVSGEFSGKRKSLPKGKAKESSVGASPSTNPTKGAESTEDSNSKRSKPMEKNANGFAEEETKENNDNSGEERQSKSNNSKPQEPPKDYIHVRARRGQATDSHSLAERVRREKISERMKLLQDLVPGCNKVTGKALMLDEIINYVQSLQRQVEFLSMKLSSVNTRLDSNVDSLMSKNIIQSNNSKQNPICPYDSSAASILGQKQQQNPTVHSNNFLSNRALPQMPIDQFAIFTNMQLPPPTHQFADHLPQYPTFCEDDLQTIVLMGLGQNPTRETVESNPNSFHGSNQVPHIKTIP